jgi:hypothetical protein
MSWLYYSLPHHRQGNASSKASAMAGAAMKPWCWGLPRKMIEVLGEEFYAAHAARMIEIKNNIDFRVIVAEDETALKYLDENDTQERLRHGRLFLLKHKEKTIGYCLTVPVAINLVEIENYGLFPEHNAKGHGGPLLRLVMAELIKDADNIILYSRSTNHKKVPAFYSRQNMVMTAARKEPNDLCHTTVPSLSFTA